MLNAIHVKSAVLCIKPSNVFGFLFPLPRKGHSLTHSHTHTSSRQKQCPRSFLLPPTHYYYYVRASRSSSCRHANTNTTTHGRKEVREGKQGKKGRLLPLRLRCLAMRGGGRGEIPFRRHQFFFLLLHSRLFFSPFLLLLRYARMEGQE